MAEKTKSKSSDVICQSSRCCPSMESSVSVPLHAESTGHPFLWDTNRQYMFRDFPDICMVVQYRMSFVCILSSLPSVWSELAGQIYLFSLFKLQLGQTFTDRVCISVLREKFGPFQEGFDSCPIWKQINCSRSVSVFRIH